jgi:hypothetical protein
MPWSPPLDVFTGGQQSPWRKRFWELARFGLWAATNTVSGLTGNVIITIGPAP